MDKYFFTLARGIKIRNSLERRKSGISVCAPHQGAQMSATVAEAFTSPADTAHFPGRRFNVYGGHFDLCGRHFDQPPI